MKTQAYVREVSRAARFIQARAPWDRLETAVILGSGIGSAAPELERKIVLPYEKIPGFPRTTVSGHRGQLLMGFSGTRGVAVLQGRFHYYEGHPMSSIALPLRALKALGLK